MPNDKEENTEEEEAKKYVLEHELIRPSTNIFNVLASVIIFLIFVFAVGSLLVLLLYAFHVFNYIKDNVVKIIIIVLIYFLTFNVFLFLNLKRALIGLIKCYQHYAKEETRRRCLCKPTCSEYSIQVLEKYHLFKALNKIRRRLFVVCRGDKYKIDLP